jgi:hypothetical protein
MLDAKVVEIFAGVVDDMVRLLERTVTFLEVSTIDVVFCTREEVAIEPFPPPVTIAETLTFGAGMFSPGYIGLAGMPVVSTAPTTACDDAISTTTEVSDPDAFTICEAPIVVANESASTPILEIPVVAANKLPTAALPA